MLANAYNALTATKIDHGHTPFLRQHPAIYNGNPFFHDRL